MSVLQTTRALNTASGNATLAHGLGRTPKYIQVFAKCKASPVDTAGNAQMLQSDGWSDGSSHKCVWAGTITVGDNPYPSIMGADNDASYCLKIINIAGSGATQTSQVATATFDGTNVTLAFTKGGAGSVTNTIAITVIVFG